MSDGAALDDHELDVVVVGSANLDVVVSLPTFAGPGETVLADEMTEVAGGKGLNQAIAASHAGARTAFVASVGDDPAGGMLLEALDNAGVDTRHVVRQQHPSGRALIQVVPGGENSIVVLPLANRQLPVAAVRSSLGALRPAVVLCQLEIPLDVVEAAATWASQHDARFVLNCSPVCPVGDSLLALADPLVVNAGEAKALLQQPGETDRGADELDVPSVAMLLASRARSVVVTDGGDGVHVGNAADGLTHVAARSVAAVDTTGAGDAFAGTLAAGLARGLGLRAAAAGANVAAASIVQQRRSDRRP